MFQSDGGEWVSLKANSVPVLDSTQRRYGVEGKKSEENGKDMNEVHNEGRPKYSRLLREACNFDGDLKNRCHARFNIEVIVAFWEDVTLLELDVRFDHRSPTKYPS
jgi:hypothetical protein